MQPARLAASVAISAFFVAAATSHADIAFNNFGPGDTYNGASWLLNGPQAPVPWSQGFRFVAAATGPVTTLVVPLYHLQGENAFSFELYSDAGGVLGASLGVVGQAAGSNILTPLPPPIQIPAGGSIQLSSGTSYWLFGRAVGSTQGSWRQNNQGQSAPRVYSADASPLFYDTQTMAAFRIEVAPPPCPADYDHNGQVQPADVSLFVNTWFASLVGGTLAGDFDNNGQVQPADVSLFVSTWLAAVTNGC